MTDWPAMHLRAATGHDFEAIASWIPDAEAARRWAGPLLDYPFKAADLPAALAIPGCEVSSHCLVDDSQLPFGFGQHWEAQPGAVHLGRIIVAPSARGRGLGRLLCLHLIDAALQNSQARVVTLRAYRSNVGAVKLYESLGFARDASESSDEILFMKKFLR